MPKVTKTQNDQALRTSVFDMLMTCDLHNLFTKVNDRQYGIIMVDLNGERRYCKIPVIVAELREDFTADELMAMDIEEYELKQKAKAEKAKEKANKIAKDKAKREAEAKKNEEVSAS